MSNVINMTIEIREYALERRSVAAAERSEREVYIN